MTTLAISRGELALAVVVSTEQGKHILRELERCMKLLEESATVGVVFDTGDWETAEAVVRAIKEFDGCNANLVSSYTGPEFRKKMIPRATIMRNIGD